ncbi:MAG: DsrE family protein [Pikeienuella sp.]
MALLKTLLAVALAAVVLSSPLQAEAGEPPHHFFYNITTDDSLAAGRALTHASVAVNRGHRVTVFLNVRAVHLAERDIAQGSYSVTAKTPRDVLTELIASGQTVLVCGICMVAGGVGKDDLIEGATITGPETTFTALTQPDTIVLSY